MVTWRDYLIEESRRREMVDQAGGEAQYRLLPGRPSRWASWFKALMVWGRARVETLASREQSSRAPEASSSVQWKPVTGKMK